MNDRNYDEKCPIDLFFIIEILFEMAELVVLGFKFSLRFLWRLSTRIGPPGVIVME